MIELQGGASRCIGPYCAQAPAQAVNWNGSNGKNWQGNGNGTAYGRSTASGNGGYGGVSAPMPGISMEHDHDMDISPGDSMTNLPQEDFDMPLTAGEAARSSWRALLARNIGRSVIVTFLMGTQSTVVVEGTLYEVGSDYLVIYQSAWESNITADLYSVKFVEFREPPSAQG